MNRLQQISRWALLLYIVLSMSLLGAQNASQIDVLTTDDGLLFRDVSDIAQDHKGLLWIGTTQGLNRYDGYSFKAYNSDKDNPFYIEDDFIKANMFYDRQSNSLWYNASDKLFQLQLNDDTVKSYDEDDNLKGQVIGMFKAPDDSIWFVTDDYWKAKKGTAKQYLQKYHNGRFKVMVAVDRFKRGFNQVILDATGHVWWTTTSGTYKYNPDGKLLEKLQLDAYDWNGDIIYYVPQFFDSQNTHYYFPASKGGIKVYDASTKRSQTILNTDNIIRRAVEDQNHNVWFAGDTCLYKMDTNGNFKDYTKVINEKLDFSQINNLFIDNSGLLWGATDNGLFKVETRKNVFTNLFKSDDKGWGNSMRGIFKDTNSTLFSLCESKHQLWYKTTKGIVDSLPLKTESGKPLTLLYDTSFLIPDTSKNVAYAVGKGICEIDLKTGETKIYEQFAKNNKIYGPNSLLKLKDGRLVFGYTLNLLTVFNPETGDSQIVFGNLKDDDNIADLQFFEDSNDSNTIWVGTKNNGVLKIDLSGKILEAYNSNTSPALEEAHVLSMLEDDDGSLWVGTYGKGLHHISADGTHIKSYKKAEGLPDDNVVAILKEGDTKFWISTYNGLSLFDKTTEDFKNFYVQDGLSHNEFNYSSYFKDSQGRYYFGGMNGVNMFNPKDLQASAQAPTIQFVRLSGFNSRNKEFYTTDYAQQELKQLVVSPYDQYVEVHWAMPSYFENDKHTYHTQLEGFEDRWFYQGNASSIRYNKLPAGDYVLKVKGKDARGNESASILSIPIHVKQIFYKRWWFMALVLLAITAIIYAIFKYRLQQVLAMERLRTKIASDLHDDVGSMLSGLAMQTELLEANANAVDKSKLQKIASISRNAISQMRDLVWSIDSRRQTTKDLMERVQELAEELLLPKDIVFKIENEAIKFPNKKLAPQTKQNIFLIVKEALTNVVRHSNATEVTIAIKQQNQGSCITICDNGTTSATPSTGLGLSNMNMRAEQIKGGLAITKGSGFCITLQLPFYL